MDQRNLSIAKLAASQRGLVTRGQLRDLKVSDSAIARRIESGLLRRIHTSVFASALIDATFEQAALAAVYAAGATAFASHSTAARLWDLQLELATDDIEVTTVLERQPRVVGVRMHRSGLLIDPDIAVLDGIPVSTPARTLYDLSSRTGPAHLAVAVDDALRRRLTSFARLSRVVRRLPPAPGRSRVKMNQILERRAPTADDTDSVLEDFVFDALRRFGIEQPVPQHWVTIDGRPRRIDACYPNRLLALEAMGFEFHGMRSRFDEDAMRGNELQLAGFRVLEFTSAFDDWTIAVHVARALEVSPPERPPTVFGFEEWKHANRLCEYPPESDQIRTNGR